MTDPQFPTTFGELGTVAPASGRNAPTQPGGIVVPQQGVTWSDTEAPLYFQGSDGKVLHRIPLGTITLMRGQPHVWAPDPESIENGTYTEAKWRPAVPGDTNMLTGAVLGKDGVWKASELPPKPGECPKDPITGIRLEYTFNIHSASARRITDQNLIPEFLRNGSYTHPETGKETKFFQEKSKQIRIPEKVLKDILKEGVDDADLSDKQKQQRNELNRFISSGQTKPPQQFVVLKPGYYVTDSGTEEVPGRTPGKTKRVPVKDDFDLVINTNRNLVYWNMTKARGKMWGEQGGLVAIEPGELHENVRRVSVQDPENPGQVSLRRVRNFDSVKLRDAVTGFTVFASDLAKAVAGSDDRGTGNSPMFVTLWGNNDRPFPPTLGALAKKIEYFKPGVDERDDFLANQRQDRGSQPETMMEKLTQEFARRELAFRELLIASGVPEDEVKTAARPTYDRAHFGLIMAKGSFQYATERLKLTATTAATSAVVGSVATVTAINIPETGVDESLGSAGSLALRTAVGVLIGLGTQIGMMMNTSITRQSEGFSDAERNRDMKKAHLPTVAERSKSSLLGVKHLKQDLAELYRAGSAIFHIESRSVVGQKAMSIASGVAGTVGVGIAAAALTMGASIGLTAGLAALPIAAAVITGLGFKFSNDGKKNFAKYLRLGELNENGRFAGVVETIGGRFDMEAKGARPHAIEVLNASLGDLFGDASKDAKAQAVR